MNPLFKVLGGNAPQQQMTGPFARFGNAMNAMRKFQQFRANFRGDPRQEVQRLLDSGQMTQEQFNQLHSMASQFMQFLK